MPVGPYFMNISFTCPCNAQVKEPIIRDNIRITNFANNENMRLIKKKKKQGCYMLDIIFMI